jgi:hypothetical protein
VNPNLTTYSMADQIERHRINSRPELLKTRRVRPIRPTEKPGGSTRGARPGGLVLSLIGKVQGTLPVRRSPALPQ